MSFIKKAMNAGMETDIRSAEQIEAELFGMVFGTEDKAEGMAAFLDKRSAVFHDR
jgi:enoyl-CoA hydratase